MGSSLIGGVPLGLALLPDLILGGGALAVLLFAVWPAESARHTRRVHAAAMLVVLAALAACVGLATAGPTIAPAAALAGDTFRWAMTAVVLVATLGALVLARDYNGGAALVAPEPPALVLLSATGMLLLGAARDLTLVFLGIEVMSVAVYVLAGLDRRRPGSAEAALKYFLLGAFSTAFLVYGMALVYGATGATQFGAIAEAIRSRDLAGDPILVAGTALLFVGFAFKVAAVPFHMWAPDVYQGAPTPYTAFMAAGVKIAAFAGLARLASEALGPAFDSWYPVVWMLAAVTMVAGNVLALTQRNVKRMLAYSSVAHAGYLLVAVAAGTGQATAAIVFYGLAYTLATLGAFGVLTIVSGGLEERTTLDDLAGLVHVRPRLAAAMTVFMLSFLGFPLAGGMGFFAKWYVLRAAMEAPGPLVKLAVLLVLASVVSAGYYLGVVATMYMKPRAEGAAPIPATPRLTGALVAVAAVVTLALGVYPVPAIRWAREAALAGPPGREAAAEAAGPIATTTQP
ncbi:MAG: NADH-quinone oxidoreductase subunit N [Gemmatimonadaceae bacterium]|nr:NADH-quinone oxidoreductase subunit N [Gemmatimonadaceae bacterium]